MREEIPIDVAAKRAAHRVKREEALAINDAASARTSASTPSTWIVMTRHIGSIVASLATWTRTSVQSIRAAIIASMSRFLGWLRSTWRRVMSAERGASDDLPAHHDRQSAADEARTLPPGGAGRL